MLKYFLIGLIVITTGIIIAVLNLQIWQNSTDQPVKLQAISIATIPHSFTAYSIFVALENGHFQKHGLDVTLIPYVHGKATLNAVVRGETTLGVSSETPFMHTVLNGGAISVFVTTMTARNHLAIVTRKDRGIFTAKDLKGKTIGVTTGTNGEYFMDMVLLFHGILKDDVRTFHIKPGDMADALLGGEVDAIATWNPQKHKAEKSLGSKGSVFYEQGLYETSFIVSARQDYIRSNPDVIEKVVRSLHEASIYIQYQPDRSRKIVAKHLRKDEETFLNELSAIYDFSLSLEQSLLLTLEDQSKWAIRNKLSDSRKIPNYLDHIYTKALKSVSPNSVTITK